jgi:hypothetical protein
MGKDQPPVAGVVVSFKTRSRLAVYLTSIDRMELCDWQDAARAGGYDRMNIHECDGDAEGEYGDFVCLHRTGEAWSRWGFARKGAWINVWCCLTGADIGKFPSMAAAFEAVLPGAPLKPYRTQSMSAVVTALVPRLRHSANRLGSAA